MNGWNIPATFTFGEDLLSADMNAQLRDNMNFLKLHIALEPAIPVAIAANAIAITQSHHVISNAGTLETINGGAEGDVLLLRADGVVIVKNEVGNIYAGGADITLISSSQYIMLIYTGEAWGVISGGGSRAKPEPADFNIVLDDNPDLTNNTGLAFDLGGV